MNNRKCFSTVLKCTLVAFVLLAFGSLVFAVYGTFQLSGAEMLLTSSHTAATTGDTVTFTLTLPPSTGFVLQAGIRISEPFHDSHEFIMTRIGRRRYEFNYTIRGRTSGRQRVWAEVLTLPLDSLRSKAVDLIVIPRMDTLSGMRITRNTIAVTVGEETQINVLGAFDDGFDRIINEAFTGTTYEITGSQEIASVNEDGLIRGLKPGEGVLAVRNGGISTTARLMVLQSASCWPSVEITLDSKPEVDIGAGRIIQR